MKNVIYLFALVIISLSLHSCGTSTGMSIKSLLKIKKGMSEREYDSILENEACKSELSLNIDDKPIKVKVFKKYASSFGSTYFVTFVNGKLFYWGHPYEYARNRDPFINKIGEQAIKEYMGDK